MIRQAAAVTSSTDRMGKCGPRVESTVERSLSLS